MKFSSAIMGLALLTNGVFGQKATVKNNCKATVYVQSFPYDGSAKGTLTTLTTGKTYTETFKKSGSTIKIATTKTLTNPLFFGYSFTANPDYAYYELNSEWGNPFAKSRNILTPGAGCEKFDCASGKADCYSTPAHKKVYGCPQPVDLSTTLCA
ncbi:hypothetical protein AK830_g10021 [Neonectria ditissima]|uniref:Uncharacterized protein n=1 Tax=Neonectria ditissima TaxID=78410 RepID=A0A0P7BB96_9HYPO|nr:hypothetical protein AK830_g10021 [Neonectria ditissima]